MFLEVWVYMVSNVQVLNGREEGLNAGTVHAQPRGQRTLDMFMVSFSVHCLCTNGHVFIWLL